MSTIQLRHPIKGARGMITEVKFREPTFEDFMAIGDPRLVVRSGDKLYFQEIDDAVRLYIEKLADIDVNYLPQMKLADTLACKKAVLDFFAKAEAPTKPITSDA